VIRERLAQVAAGEAGVHELEVSLSIPRLGSAARRYRFSFRRVVPENASAPAILMRAKQTPGR
jgi:hypothetical protein